MPGTEAFVTLCTNDAYAIGALVLAHSIRKAGTSRDLCVMITDDVRQPMREALHSTFNHVEMVKIYDSHDEEHLKLLQRPDLGCTFTKLHCWRLTQYTKCVFIDADCLVIKPIDDLFDREELSAAPDLGWPDCFNSGLFVYVPSEETYSKLIEFSLTHGSFDGADQGLLNTFFSGWSTADIKYHIPFIYNVVPSIFYTYRPAILRYKSDIKVAHFLGSMKPWHTTYDPYLGIVKNVSEAEGEFYTQWWKVLYENVIPSLGPLLTQTVLPVKLTDRPFIGSQEHKEAWERGEIDYLGADSFENIKQFLTEIIESEFNEK